MIEKWNWKLESYDWKVKLKKKYFTIFKVKFCLYINRLNKKINRFFYINRWHCSKYVYILIFMKNDGLMFYYY